MLSDRRRNVASVCLSWINSLNLHQWYFVHLSFKIPECTNSNYEYLWCAQHESLSLKELPDLNFKVCFLAQEQGTNKLPLVNLLLCSCSVGVLLWLSALLLALLMENGTSANPCAFISAGESVTADGFGCLAENNSACLQRLCFVTSSE